MTNIINLLSCPRNLSTALMYSFAQRSDCIVVDEPFYAYYLKKSAKKHPMYDEIILSQPHSYQDVVDQIHMLAKQHTYVFLKNMCHHQPEDLTYLSGCKNIIYIRRPEQIAHSFKQIIPEATEEDLGYTKQFELFIKLKNDKTQPVIFDSAYLQFEPERALKSLCKALSISFDTKMLTWKTGGIPEDGIWADIWYQKVHQTTGFEKRITQLPSLPDGDDIISSNYRKMRKEAIELI